MKRLHQLYLVIALISSCIFFYEYSDTKNMTIKLGIFAGSYWNVPSSSYYKQIDYVIKKYEKLYPNVKVTYESGIPSSQYSSWIANKFINEDAPDIFLIPHDDFNYLANNHALLNLETFVDKDKINLYQLYDASRKAGYYQGNLYALPYSSNFEMMCVNNDLLKKNHIKLPNNLWTLDNFYQICKQLTNIDKKQFGQFGYTWKDAIASYNINIFKNGGNTIYINNNEVKEALDFIMKLQNLNNNYVVTAESFDQGQVAFRPLSLAEYRTYKAYPYRVSRYSNFNWSILPMPISKKPYYQISTSLFGISSHSHHKQQAWNLLKLLSLDEEIQQKVLENEQGISVLQNVMSKQKAQKYLNQELGQSKLSIDLINEIMNHGMNVEKFQKYQELQEKADYYITKSLENHSIDSDLETIQQYLQESL